MEPGICYIPGRILSPLQVYDPLNNCPGRNPVVTCPGKPEELHPPSLLGRNDPGIW